MKDAENSNKKAACNARKVHAKRQRGLSVLEIVLALAIGAILLAIAAPAYDRYIDRARSAQAMADVSEMSTQIVRFYSDNNGVVPDSLAAVGLAGKLDPWGRPYYYLNLTTMAGKGAARKDKSLVPINSDFDLYSAGKDGATLPPLTAKPSRDDIVRGNNGRFIGLGADY